MVEVKSLKDSLTGIYNEEYLKKYYHSYLRDNPRSNFVMIDFEKFKSINDLYGHNVGDDYLKVFARILSDNFPDSLVVRLHGDEFSVLTCFSEDEIAKRFDLCNEGIKEAVELGEIPSMFRYNSGSTVACEDIDITKEKADFMMYHAKDNRDIYQPYSKEIYQRKIDQDNFLAKIDDYISNEKFTYAARGLFDSKGNALDMFQIYTRDEYGKSLFGNNGYEMLKKSNKLLQFDYYNIQNILDGLKFLDGNFIITIDHKSLITTDRLFRYLIMLKDIIHMPFDNIILSVDLSLLISSNYVKVIDSINRLKEFGFKVRLEKIDSNVGDVILENTNIDYIKFSNEYWQMAMNNSKVNYLLRSKIDMFNVLSESTIPIFGHVDNEEQFKFLNSITSDNTLFGGNYFSREKGLILKR